MVKKHSTASWSREQWQEWRRTVKTIGGSDAAAVVGLSPYKSPYSLWAEKTGAMEQEDISGKEAVRLGNDLEDYVARRWAEATGKKARRERAILTNPEYTFAHANIDRAVVGEPDAGLECKTTSSFDTIRLLRDGEIPDTWYCQCQHYMFITGAKRWYLAVVAFGAGFFHFTIQRDQRDIEALVQAEAAFYRQVMENDPPAPDASPASLATMSLLMPHSDGTVLDAALITAHLMAASAIKSRIFSLQEELRREEAAIKSFMGTAERAVSGDYCATWKTQTRSTFDRARYEQDNGPIPDAYFTKSTTRPFQVKIKKKE